MCTDIWEDMPSNKLMQKFRLTFRWPEGTTPDITRVVQHLRTDTNKFSFVMKACKKPNGMCFSGGNLTNLIHTFVMIKPLETANVSDSETCDED